MTYGTYDISTNGSMQTMSPTASIISLIIAVVEIIAMWKLYVKAGKPGWAAIIPIYNVLVMIEIAKKPWWYLLLMLIPIVNFVIAIMITLDFVKAYGKDTVWGILAIFFAPIIYPILAFGDSKYVG